MSFLNGLHGTVAALLLCALLFVDEAGVPLPFAPNEALLIIAGWLMASGAMPVWLFMPLAYVALCAGMLAGWSWAHALGSTGLRRVAMRVRAHAAFDRAQLRLRRATPVSLGITRLIPGVRTYATLIAGAAQTDLRTFCLGAMPALAVWEVGVCALGAAVGFPAEHFLTQFQELVVTGIVLLVAVAASVLAIRHIPGEDLDPGMLTRGPAWERMLLALALDVGVVATLAAGCDRIVRGVLRSTRLNGPVDVVVLVAAVIVAYVAVTRLGPGRTAGEGLFEVSYRAGHWRRPRQALRRSRRPRRAATGDD